MRRKRLGTSKTDRLQLLAKSMSRPLWLKVPSFILRRLLGQMGEELILSGQVVLPKRLIDLGFVFQFDHLAVWFEKKW